MPKGAAFRRAADHGVTHENRKRMWDMCWADPSFAEAVQYFRMEDGLLDSDWVVPEAKAGFGQYQMAVQDGGGALLKNQLIPASVVDVQEHIAYARLLEHPAASIFQGSEVAEGHDYEPRRDAEVESAVRRNVEAGDAGPYVVRHRILVFERVSDSLLGLSRRLRESISPPHIRCTPFAHAHSALAAAVVAALQIEDGDLPLRMLVGAPVAGDLTPTHAWDGQYKPRSTGLDFDDLPHSQWNEWLHVDVARQARTPNGRETATAVWEKTIKELDKGLCDGPFEFDDMVAMYGPEGFRSIRRFGILQNEEIRVCDNARESQSNAGSTERDKLRTQSPDFAARASARFARHKGPGVRGWTLEHGTDDIDAAYRRVLNATPGFTVVPAFNPALGRVQYFVHPGFNFGLVSAVLYFNAVPACIAAVARRVLAIVCDHYFDDFDTVALRGQGAAYQNALRRLMAAFGYPFSEKKHVPAAPANAFLGVITDFSRLEREGVVELGVSPRRKEKLAALCALALVSLSPPEAEVLAGKIGWTLQWTFGKVGRAALQPIHVRASATGGRSDVTVAIRRAVTFIRDVVRSLPRREILLDRPSRPPVLIWSDAMYETKAAEPAAGGFVALFPAEPELGLEEEVLFSSDVTTAAVMDRFMTRKQYIGQLEILYAVSPYWTLGSRLAGRHVIHFIDNTSACAGLVKGYASSIDSGLMVNAFHAFNVGLRVDVFFEYVRSKANIGDLPSRLAMDELWEMFETIGVASRAREVAMVMPRFHDWYAPAARLLSAGVAAAAEASPSRKRAITDGGRDTSAARKWRRVGA